MSALAEKPPSVCKESVSILIAFVVLLIFGIPAIEIVAAVEEPIVVTPALLQM